jgi:hypothetical protein
MQIFLRCDTQGFRINRVSLGRLLNGYVGQSPVPVEITLKGNIGVQTGGNPVLTGEEAMWYKLPGVYFGFVQPDVGSEYTRFQSLLIRFSETECDEEALVEIITTIVDRLRSAGLPFKMACLRQVTKNRLLFQGQAELHEFLSTAVQALLINARGDKTTEYPLLPVVVI